MRGAIAAGLLLALGACSGTSGSDAGTVPDAGAPGDAGVDAGGLDAGPRDAGPTDAGAADAGGADAGPSDSGTSDAGKPDAGPSDAGGIDAGTLWAIGTGIPVQFLGFPAGGTGFPAPSATIQGPFLLAPRGIGADSAGNVYVTSLASSVDQVLVFAPGATAPTRTVTSADWGSNAGLKALAVDGAGTLYTLGDVVVGGIQNYGVAVFAPGAGGGASALRTFSSPAFTTNGVSPEAIAIDASGDVFVTFQDSRAMGADQVLEFGAGASGAVSPSRTISGASTQLGVAAVYGVAVDTGGEIFVACAGDALGSRVLVFAAGTTSGDQAPARELSGLATKFNQPWGLAINPADGNLYVSDYIYSTPGYAVEVYPLAANGNQAPARIFYTSQTGDSGVPVQVYAIAIGP